MIRGDMLDKVPAEHKYNVDIWYLEEEDSWVFKINGVNERFAYLIIDDEGVPFNMELLGTLGEIGEAITEEIQEEHNVREEAKQRASEIAFMKRDAKKHLTIGPLVFER